MNDDQKGLGGSSSDNMLNKKTHVRLKKKKIELN
jgi:hypothetical protein